MKLEGTISRPSNLSPLLKRTLVQPRGGPNVAFVEQLACFRTHKTPWSSLSLQGLHSDMKSCPLPLVYHVDPFCYNCSLAVSVEKTAKKVCSTWRLPRHNATATCFSSCPLTLENATIKHQRPSSMAFPCNSGVTKSFPGRMKKTSSTKCFRWFTSSKWAANIYIYSINA